MHRALLNDNGGVMRTIRAALRACLACLVVLTVSYCGGTSGNDAAVDVSEERRRVTYGISPYQDTIIPKYADIQGWYEQEGIVPDLRVLAWGDIMPAIGGGVDVAIQNFNSFQASYWNLRARGIEPVFYYPFFVFKGAAILIPATSELRTAEDFSRDGLSRRASVRAAAAQLEGRSVAATIGTEMEQLVTAALDQAGLADARDQILIHAQPADALAAFLTGSVDAFSAGVTEQTEAARSGARVLVSSADILPAVIDGLVTTSTYVEENGELLDSLVALWFRSIRHLDEDLPTRAPLLLEFLNSVGSTRYTVEEYREVWNRFDYFPRTEVEAEAQIMSPSGEYYWRRSWEGTNELLLQEGTISRAVPSRAFLPAVP